MKMDEGQLVAAIEQHEAQAETYGNLQEDRTEALDYYLGKPMGNEVPGRSQVIARQVWDTVEWIKPQLAEIFCSGEELLAFSPRAPDDVKAAEQETDYINYVITQRNPWFETWYTWSHDALIQKNGYVKAYWDDSEDLAVERYQKLTTDEYMMLMQDHDIEVREHEEEMMVEMNAMGQPMEFMYHSVVIERKRKKNQVRIENLAPEHVRISQNVRTLNLQDPRVPFVEHAEFKTLSELRNDGFDVPDDLMDSGDGVGDWEEDLRDDYTPFRDREGEESDPSMRRVKVRECWIRVDYDGDGVAELRHVILVGTTILLNEDCDTVPIIALCPTPLAHRHYGLSLADAVMDLQKIQTALLRGALDNQYLANNGRYAISENVNLDDMLDSRPGGVVRVLNGAQPGSEIFPLQHSSTGSITVPMMEYIDRLAQKRTGVNEQSQGLDPNALNKTATGAQMLMSAAQQRIKFIARIFAETGVRSLFQLVHELTLKNSRQQEMVRLRGEWVPVDPRTWVKRNDMVVSVAIGNADKAQQMVFLMQTLNLQKEGIQVGLANPKTIYNTLARLTKTAGYKDVNEFWVDPSTVPPQPPQEPPPDPRVIVEQMRQQSDIARFQAEQQMTQEIERIKSEAKLRETQMNLELQAANDARDSERERMKAEMDAQIEQMKISNQQSIAELNASIEKYRADLQSQTQIYLKQMELGVDPQTITAQQEVMNASTEQNQALMNMLAQIQMQNEESAQRMMQMVNATNQQMQQAIQSVQESMNSPKEIVRGPDGKAVGVRVNGQVRPINRGPDGRVVGV